MPPELTANAEWCPSDSWSQSLVLPRDLPRHNMYSETMTSGARESKSYDTWLNGPPSECRSVLVRVVIDSKS